MKKFDITGMSCAACSARIEKAVSKLDGVTECKVNLLANSMSVNGSCESVKIIEAVEKAGYGARETGIANPSEQSALNSEKEVQNEKYVLAIRLAVSVVLTLTLMYLSMGHTMLGLPLPGFIAGNGVSIAILQLMLSGLVMILNRKFFTSGVKGVIKLSPNMDTLVSMGSFAAFAYSFVTLMRMSAAQNAGDLELVQKLLHELYFETAAMILTLITVGKLLESVAKGKTTNALKGLMSLTPENALLVTADGVSEIASSELKPGDIIAVKPGASVPADGIVLNGETAINESAITGEGIPAEKKKGDTVTAGTINTYGYIECRVTEAGSDTTLAQIIRMVNDAQLTKAPVSRVADRVSGIFVPAVLLIALITFAVWMLLGQSAGFAVERAISVLVISCPCALGLATPVAIMVGSGVGARRGILFKNAEALEMTGKIKTVILDKTGTVTKGAPSVSGIYPAERHTASELKELAYLLEKNSEHPIARAIVEATETPEMPRMTAENFRAVSGLGVTADVKVNGITKECRAGNQRFVSETASLPEVAIKTAESEAAEGKTVIFFCNGNEYCGMISVSDELKSDSREAIKRMEKSGKRVIMLTGDSEGSAQAIAKKAGIEEVVAGVLPGGKKDVVDKLKNEDKSVIMVGDGINDAPALTSATVGIAIGAATDIAIDSADVVLMKEGLTGVNEAITVSKKTLRNIHQNLFWAFIYNVIGIPVAAGAFYFTLGISLSPMIGAAAMSLSGFCVVMNSLRLNLMKIPNGISNKNTENNLKKETKGENSIMKIEMKIDGMMCAHCEARVKKAIEELPFVEKAEVNHKKGLAEITVTEDGHGDEIAEAVGKQGYNVVK